jgi:hypothetical protein
MTAMNRAEEFATGNGQWHGMDKPTYTKHYNRGWKAEKTDDDEGLSLERGDARGENKAWYDGHADSATERPKYHSRECSARDHGMC